MDDIERKLLLVAYEIGFRNAQDSVEMGIDITSIAPKKEAERWIDEPIADNGGTCGEYVAWECKQ